MQAEQIKLIAENMYPDKNVLVLDYLEVWCVWSDELDNRYKFLYNPEYDDKQCMELIATLGMTVGVDSNGGARYAEVWDSNINFYEEIEFEHGKPESLQQEMHMIRRLVCKAAYKYFLQNPRS